MDAALENEKRILLIDTCGEDAAVALCGPGGRVFVEELPDRTASAGIVAAVRRLLAAGEVRLVELGGVGVVSGPGSFTGVRAGLAAAKGLCEASGVPMAAVSRLAVLAEAAGLRSGYAVLNAGRQELYVREQREGVGREWLCGVAEFASIAMEQNVVYAEERVAEWLAAAAPQFFRLRVQDALGPVMAVLQGGGSDVETVDANYVRGAKDIYRKATSAAVGTGSR